MGANFENSRIVQDMKKLFDEYARDVHSLAFKHINGLTKDNDRLKAELAERQPQPEQPVGKYGEIYYRQAEGDFYIKNQNGDVIMNVVPGVEEETVKAIVNRFNLLAGVPDAALAQEFEIEDCTGESHFCISNKPIKQIFRNGMALLIPSPKPESEVENE